MSREIADAILLNVDGLIYNEKKKRYIVTPSYVLTMVNENLNVKYKGPTKESGRKNAEEICDRCSRQFYNYEYGNQRMWPEDFDKKQYLLLTDENTVKVSRDIMLSHIESTILTRRDLLILEHGVDLDGSKLIEDFDQHMDKYRFSTDTREIFNQDRNLKYKERLTNRDIEPTVIREGY